ncbi:DUF3781 domain-containing protein [Candidatus Brachybacter algidus]|jgi:hypothetical protein|uniref:DUF3781 domain-containing protein n=1 Tax=Candidatus Brachybacter algidus TaxID=2982024 RepID=UPI001B6580F3|nr:DUF3781 domain-containing protein [Saprospiraceae bacterium]MBP9124552.1 DUF3781 domain-containing protein [Saprospiraceae bacterium]MBP9844661.1 DUF3781 domain-containing protein [Saprospiraceae bacterium]
MLMKINKEDLISSICYTELVYGRINKKLNLCLSNSEIEALIIDLIIETDDRNFKRIGKNIYVLNFYNKISITINSNTNRVITVDRMKN